MQHTCSSAAFIFRDKLVDATQALQLPETLLPDAVPYVVRDLFVAIDAAERGRRAWFTAFHAPLAAFAAVEVSAFANHKPLLVSLQERARAMLATEEPVQLDEARLDENASREPLPPAA